MDFAAPEAFPSSRPAQSNLLFSTGSYSEWVKLGMQLRATRPDTLTLFESTIAEPASELVEVLRHGFAMDLSSRYVSVFAGGNPFAIQALSRRYGVPADHFLTTTGATSSLQMLFKTLVQPSDHVLIETPGFNLLAMLARNAGATIGSVSRRAPDFGIDIADLRRKLRRDTRAVIVTNLHNPSGAMLSEACLIEIAAIAAEVGADVIVDEVYADFARPEATRTAAALADNIIAVSSLTKVFGLFALKFGWICAAPSVLATIRRIQPDGDIGVSKLSHSVAALVLESAEVFDAHWKRVLSRTRPAAKAHFDTMVAENFLEGAFPEYGCMAFPKVVGVEDTMGLAKSLWTRDDLLAAPGEYFGLPGHIRLGFGADVPAIDRGFARLHEALAQRRRQGGQA